ncbi:TlpA family protein disulfide reductase [Limibacillus halophilus]|jgi:thiol-disulfide isomerase/thioredoxin
MMEVFALLPTRRHLLGVLAALLLTLPPSAQPEAAGPPLEGPLAGNFTLLDEPVPAPQVPVKDQFGKILRLDDFKGEVVLVNFWATWCSPCVYEMPSLDRLQADLGPSGLTVMAVSVDRQGLSLVEGFFQSYGLGNLGIFLDPDGDLAGEFGVRGLPTSYLIDRRGRLVGGIQGSLEWDSREAKALIDYYLNEGGEDASPIGKASYR